MTTWFITGCSTGLGRALASAALHGGDNVVVTARTVESVHDLAAAYPDTALAVSLDVTDAQQVRDAVAAGRERFGATDILVNNAGYGYRAAVEEGEDEAVGRLFDTHFHAAVRTMKAVLPDMRAQHRGTIVNISSIGARWCPEGSGYYSAAKAALEALTFALRKEGEPLGIRAIAVEPGGFRTDFAGRSLTEAALPIDDYAETAGKRRPDQGTGHGTQPGDPAKAANVIIDAVASAEAPALLVLGNSAVDIVRASLTSLLGDIEAWEDVSRSTDFD